MTGMLVIVNCTCSPPYHMLTSDDHRHVTSPNPDPRISACKFRFWMCVCVRVCIFFFFFLRILPRKEPDNEELKRPLMLKECEMQVPRKDGKMQQCLGCGSHLCTADAAKPIWKVTEQEGEKYRTSSAANRGSASVAQSSPRSPY